MSTLAQPHTRRVWIMRAAYVIAPFWVVSTAHSAPVDGRVTSGQAVISTVSPTHLQIQQTSPSVSINWQSFNIAAGERVQFVQPGANAVALNRIVGTDATSIFGSLQANGQVFLFNPRGIFFAPTAQVDVGSLLATTMALPDESVGTGRYLLGGVSDARVDNRGSLKAAPGGFLLLAGTQVSNSGTLHAPQGQVGLAAGSRLTLDRYGDGSITYSVDAGALGARVDNGGQILADGGRVILSALDADAALSTVVNHSGLIRANRATQDGGIVTLSGGPAGMVVVSGAVEARGTEAGTTGGTIRLQGDRIAVVDGARLDASGASGGGVVSVGLGSVGMPEQARAGAVAVGSGAVLDASATVEGSGGIIRVAADRLTSFAGAALASGGGAGGNGGLVELSSQRQLLLTGRVDTLAPAGMPGKVDIAQQDLRLSNSTSGIGDTAPTVLVSISPDLEINTAIRPSQLAALSGDVTLRAMRDLRVESIVDLTASPRVTSLNLSSAHSMRLQADISVAGHLTLTGPTTLGADMRLASQSGNIDFAGAVDGAYRLTADAPSGRVFFRADVGSATPLVQVAAGAATLAGNISTTASQFYRSMALGGDIRLTAGGATVTGGIVGNGRNLTLAGSGTNTVASASGLASLTATNLTTEGAVQAGSITVSEPAVLGGNVTTTGAQRYGNLSLLSNLTLNAGAATVAAGVINANGRNLTLFNSGAGSNSVASVSNAGNLLATTLTTQGAVSAATVNVAGTAWLGGDVTTALNQRYGRMNLVSNVTLAAGGGVVSGAVSGNNRDLTLTGSGTHQIASATGLGSLVATNLTTQGTISASAVTTGAAILGGNVSTTGNQRYASTNLASAVQLSASAGSVSTGAVVGNGRNLVLAGAAGNSVATATGVASLVASNLTTQGPINATSVIATGVATLAGDVTTTGTQSYGSTVLAGHVTLNSGAATTFTGAVTGNGRNLTLAGSATNTIGTATNVGALNATALTTQGSVTAASVTTTGTATLGGDVTTTGSQSYGATVLGGNVTLNAGTGAVSTGAVTGNARNLTLAGTGSNTVASATNVGTLAATNLTALGTLTAASVTTTGPAQLAGTVATTGNQRYGSLTLSGNTVLNAGAGGVTVGPVTGNEKDLTLSGAGAHTVASASNVGALVATSLITQGTITAARVLTNGAAVLGGDVTTTGVQSYGSTTLAANITLNSGTANTNTGAVSGNGRNLSLEGTGTNTVASATNLGALSATNLTTQGAIVAASVTTSGLANLSGSVSTAGNQRYAGLSLSGNLALNAGAGSVTTGPVIGNGRDLTLSGAGVHGVASATNLGTLTATSLTTQGPVTAASVVTQGTATLGGDVTTTGVQNYGSTILAANLSLNSGAAATSTGPITGNGRDLTLAGSGTHTVASARDLGALSADNLSTQGALVAASVLTHGLASLGGDVTTTGNQSYQSTAVANNLILAATRGSVSFGGPVSLPAAAGQVLTVDAFNNISFGSTVAAAGNGSVGSLRISTRAPYGAVYFGSQPVSVQELVLGGVSAFPQGLNFKGQQITVSRGGAAAARAVASVANASPSTKIAFGTTQADLSALSPVLTRPIGAAFVVPDQAALELRDQQQASGTLAQQDRLRGRATRSGPHAGVAVRYDGQ